MGIRSIPFVHTYIHTYIHTCMHTYKWIYERRLKLFLEELIAIKPSLYWRILQKEMNHIAPIVCTYIHTSQLFVLTVTSTETQEFLHPYLDLNVCYYNYIKSYIHTYIHIYIYIYTYIQTYMIAIVIVKLSRATIILIII